MELRVSSPKSGDLSPSDCASDPEEKEISDEDDDDRNHKHRRRETRSNSMEGDSLEPILTRSYRKRNRPFENGHSFGENDSRGSENWKNYNSAPTEKEFTTKFDRRRLGMASFARMNMDLNQRIRSTQIFPGEPGPGRGRGRDSSSWNPRDSRFGSVDIASQMVQQGGLFAGRGLPNVPNAQNASWNTFGMLPRMPSGGLDGLHSIGLPGTLRQAVNSPLNIGIPRQRCRDFEERGFCLRGDMCPMEHGVHRIVVEDVQSLSQFNLPVSLPSAPLVATPAGPGAIPSVSASSGSLMSSKGLHSRNGKSGAIDDGMSFNGAYSGSAAGSGADLYDPDQPLWNTGGPETSTGILALHSSKDDETESFLDVDTSEQHRVRLRDNTDYQCRMRNTGIPVGSQTTSSSVWGRVGGVKNRLDAKEKTDLTANTLDYLEDETKDGQDTLSDIQGTSRQGKRIVAEDAVPKTVNASTKIQSDTVHNMRKSSQKALRTLFVSGIPQQSNKRDSLLSHFQKFGEVVDIYIPTNGDRAFVQFSKREEAEAALRSPDAVMGNRFIKLWWANRDSVSEEGVSGGTSVSVTPSGPAAASVLPQPFIANRGKDNLQSAASKGSVVLSSDVSLPPTDHSKPTATNGPKVPAPSQKKLELEQLKEELRKKQELLAQKRNDFRRQLEKIQKQATSVKDEVVTDSTAKRPRVGMANDVAKASTPRSSESAPGVPSPRAGVLVDKNKSLLQHETTVSRQPIRQGGPAGSPFPMNRYKLDNRPTSFRIIPPLPPGLTKVDVLKEHFSSFGDLSTIELEAVEASDTSKGSEVPMNCSVRVSFTTRHLAETAFLKGKCWEGNNLQFRWVTTSNTSATEVSGKEKTPPTSKSPADTGSQQSEKLAHMDSQGASASGNGDSETLERISGDDTLELNEVSMSNQTVASGEHESSKCEVSATSMSSKEESQRSEVGPTATSEEKETSMSAS